MRGLLQTPLIAAVLVAGLSACGSSPTVDRAFQKPANAACAAYLRSLGTPGPRRTIRSTAIALKHDIAMRRRLVERISQLTTSAREAPLRANLIAGLRALDVAERKSIRQTLAGYPLNSLSLAKEIDTAMSRVGLASKLLGLPACVSAARG